MEQKNALDKSAMRDSGIELLKIIATGLIVINHVVQTLRSANGYITYNDYILDCRYATTDMQMLILALMSHFGILGNWLFFTASAWFLLDSPKVSGKKMLEMLVDVWVISVIILGITLFIRGGGVNVRLLIFSLFPTTFANNWYLTCYLLFYPIHPYLNRVIELMTQKQLLKAVSTLTFFYIGFNFLQGMFFFMSVLILWVAVYFIIAYIKFYCKDSYANTRTNVLLLLCEVAGAVGIVLIINLLGLKFSVFSSHLLHWMTNYNIFLIMIAITAFGLAKSAHFKSKVINRISKCSLLIYIIHENILVRTYLRPYIWHCIFNRYGYSLVVLWVLVFAAVWFVLALILSTIYEESIQKGTKKLSEKLLKLLETLYQKYETMMLKIS